MGKYTNKKISNILGLIIVAVMTIAGILLIIDLIKQFPAKWHVRGIKYLVPEQIAAVPKSSYLLIIRS